MGVPKIAEVYLTTDKDTRMATEDKREEKQHIETLTKKKEKEDKNTVTTQAELSKYKVPKINRNLNTEIQIERSDTKRRQQQQKNLDFKTNKLPTLIKPSDTFMDYLNYQIKFLKGKDILTYYTPCDPTKDKEPLLSRELSQKQLPSKTVPHKDRLEK